MRREPSKKEIKEVREALAHRYAPLKRANDAREYWSRVESLRLELKESEYPEDAVRMFAAVFIALEDIGRDRALDAIKLLPPVRKIIEMFRNGDPFRSKATADALVAKACEELKRWDGTPLERKLRHEFRFFMSGRLEHKLRTRERFGEAHEEWLQQADEVRYGRRPQPRKEATSPHPTHVEVAYPAADSAFVTTQPFGSKVEVRGPSLVRLLRLVLQNAERDLTWEELRKAWVADACGSETVRSDSVATVDGSSVGALWRPPPAVDTFRKYARKIKKALGPAGLYWNHSGNGVRFDLPVEGRSERVA